MDKQIIIDGVDVSGCDRLNTFPMQFGEPHEICLTSLEQWGGQEKYCKDRPNCYYKQLKRKEQECEELKKEAVHLKLNLKKVINLSQKKNRQCYQFLADIKQLKTENKHLNDLLNQALKELEELQEGLANG